jgi:Flp pilus assembly protein CpaB
MLAKRICILGLVLLLAGLAPVLRAESHERAEAPAAPAEPTLFYVWTDHVVTATAANAADYHTNEERVNEVLGADGLKLILEAASYARRMERTTSVMRPDLSIGM